MARLLTAIAKGEALTPERTDLLLQIMSGDETGLTRLRGRLPAGVRVASKTGTLDVQIENDVGIIFLPDGTRVVVVAYLKEARAPGPELDRVIADLGRAAYDYFLMTPGKP
jgi:beta-lactamase class A